MSDELIFGSDGPEEAIAERPPVFGPAAAGIAALALGVTALLGQSSASVAASVAFGQPFATDSIRSYYVTLGAGTLVQALIALVLAARGSRATGWEGHLARAALIVAAVALLVGLVTVLGAILQDEQSMM